MNCGPEFCGTVPRSAGSLFLAGEARRKCSGPARRYGFPSATVRAGDDIDVVQTPLGHLSPDFHDDYLHARE